MKAIFAKILYELHMDRDLVLVTISSGRGSVPRGTGAQMLVGEKGRLLGTIGGGAVERSAEQLALEFLRQRQSGSHSFLLRENAEEDIGMVCGGDVTVWFQYIDAADSAWAELAGRLVEQVTGGEKGWLVLYADGSLPGLLEGAEQPVVSEAAVALPLPVGERAVLFGGGHCAQALAPLLQTVGFRVTVMDCRPEYADPALFPSAEQVICGDYEKISKYLTLTGEDYVVIMTSGHSFDFAVESQVLRGSFAYVGVIGSRSKKAAVNQRLREAGISEEGIQSVHMPIGTAIKAVTPEEIAVSIAGEMIYERALRREAQGAQHHGCPMGESER